MSGVTGSGDYKPFDINFVSWRMSANIADYDTLCEVAGKSLPQDRIAAEQQYAQAERRMAVKLLDMGLDALLLQDAFDDPASPERPLLQGLKQADFALFGGERSMGGNSDSLIALSKKLFTDFDSKGAKGGGVVVSATHIPSGKRIVFASAHFTGCNPERPSDDADFGDQQAVALANIVQGQKADAVIIGMDALIHPTKWPRRFNPFTKLGLQVQETKQDTHCWIWQGKRVNKEIDFVVAGQKVADSSQFAKLESLTVRLDPTIGFDPSTNSSVEKPIFGSVTILPDRL